MTAFNWRTLRPHLLNAGVPDPMALPSMHSLLDVMEQLILESKANSAKDSAEAKRSIEQFYDALYKPDRTLPDAGEYKGVKAAPFTEEESAASFATFLSATGGGSL
jgi:hypothetical protein